MTPTPGAVVAKNMAEIAKRFNIPYDMNQWKNWKPHKVFRNEKPVPIIKARYEYVLNSGKYLFEFISTDQTLSSTFRTVILREL